MEDGGHLDCHHALGPAVAGPEIARRLTVEAGQLGGTVSGGTVVLGTVTWPPPTFCDEGMPLEG